MTRSQLAGTAIAIAVAILALGGYAPVPARAAAGGLDTDTGRVFPVTTPIPMSGEKPVSPEQLTDNNPNVLPMTGPWRFSITRGQTINGVYVASADLGKFLTASSTSGGVGYWDGSVVNAIDGDIGTRWSASDATEPQWMQLDLGQVETVSAVSVEWDDPKRTCAYRIEGSIDGAAWQTLSDQSAPNAPFAGGGNVAFPAAQTRYIRIAFAQVNESPGPGASAGAALLHPAAQVAELAVTVMQNGAAAIWEPNESSDGFEAPAFDDSRWQTINVPSNWEIAGYSRPTYDDVDDAVGEYRRTATVPASFAGSNVYWRFDGVFDGAEIYVNGIKAGYHESGYTAFDVDITDLIKPGRLNTFAVRVCKKTSSVDLDTGDYEALGGIYRETYLYRTPTTHIKDLTVRTVVDAVHDSATVEASLAVAGAPQNGDIVDAKLLAPNGATVGIPAFQTLAGQLKDGLETVDFSLPVRSPKLWSAEAPNLYTLVVVYDSQATGGDETIEQPVGIRQITIGPHEVLLWNGVPIKLAGVARHEIWPSLGAALDDSAWSTDLSLMKEANINAVRTSHYNDARRFLDQCEEQGLYILDEIPYCWVNEKIGDPRYLPAFIQRATETFARDKNRPEVLAWSCGNENGGGSNTLAVLQYMHQHDPTRPAFSSVQWAGLPGQSFTDVHYPAPDDIPAMLKKVGALTPIVFTEQPHIFCAPGNLAYDPGVHDFWGVALQRSWDIVEATPQIIGSFIWEWSNQPIVSNWSDSTPNHLGPSQVWFENNKGIVDGNRNPKPEWWDVKMVYSPVQIAQRTLVPAAVSSGQVPHAAVSVRNLYSFTDLSQLDCIWQAMKNGARIDDGALHVKCAPLQSVQISVPVPHGATDVRIEFLQPPTKYAVYSALLHVEGAPLPQAPGEVLLGAAMKWQDQGTQYEISNADETVDISKSTGEITRWRQSSREALFSGPVLCLGEDHAVDAQFGLSSADYVGPSSCSEALSPKIVVQQADESVIVIERIGLRGASGEPLGDENVTYLISPSGEIGVSWNVAWTGRTTHAWEDGMRIGVPDTDRHLTWFKDSPLADYQPGSIGAPTGSIDLSDPDSSASKRGLQWLALTDEHKHGIALLSAGAPLIGRVNSGAYATTLYASSSEAEDIELSSAWVSDQDVVLTRGKPISGSFILRAF